MDAVVEELWIYPVKACGGVRVQASTFSSTGLEFDRLWCVVDREGAVVFKNEHMSGRKVPALLTVEVAISADNTQLLLKAPGMPECSVPVALEAYSSEEEIDVECSGGSTSTGAGWRLGKVNGRIHAGASFWLCTYLNRETGSDGKRMHGKAEAGNFALVRSVPETGLQMADYPAFVPWVTRALSGTDQAYAERLRGNGRQFADVAPVLLLNKSSGRFTGERCGMTGSYPLESLRGNIVVDGKKLAPWAEETWKRMDIVGADGLTNLQLSKIKECIRCTVPCRNHVTGEYIFAKEPLRLWKVLKTVFPNKFVDPEWGSWANSPFFGVYFGSGGCKGVIRVGDKIRVTETCRWDDHLQGPCTRWTAGALVVSAGALVGLLLLRPAASP